jgi:protein required for attachment to host cells
VRRIRIRESYAARPDVRQARRRDETIAAAPAFIKAIVYKENAMQVPHNTFVVVADGKKMLFFRNEGDSEFPKLEVESKRVQADLSDQEMSTDKAGRTFDASGGAGRSAYEETAEILKKRALNNEFEQLIIVAPPRTLGELRKHYHKEVQKRLAGEIAKDLTGHPVAEIEKIIQAE